MRVVNLQRFYPRIFGMGLNLSSAGHAAAKELAGAFRHATNNVVPVLHYAIRKLDDLGKAILSKFGSLGYLLIAGIIILIGCVLLMTLSVTLSVIAGFFSWLMTPRSTINSFPWPAPPQLPFQDFAVPQQFAVLPGLETDLGAVFKAKAELLNDMSVLDKTLSMPPSSIETAVGEIESKLSEQKQKGNELAVALQMYGEQLVKAQEHDQKFTEVRMAHQKQALEWVMNVYKHDLEAAQVKLQVLKEETNMKLKSSSELWASILRMWTMIAVLLVLMVVFLINPQASLQVLGALWHGTCTGFQVSPPFRCTICFMLLSGWCRLVGLI